MASNDTSAPLTSAPKTRDLVLARSRAEATLRRFEASAGDESGRPLDATRVALARDVLALLASRDVAVVAGPRRSTYACSVPYPGGTCGCGCGCDERASMDNTVGTCPCPECRAARLGAGETGAIRDLAAERARQVRAEGWTPDHDDAHTAGQIANAAACYAATPDFRRDNLCAVDPDTDAAMGWPPEGWPWEEAWWKPTPADRRRELVKAGALIVAEIERLDRALAAPADARAQQEMRDA